MEEPILVSTVSNSSEIELSDGQSLGSLDGEAHVLLGASPRRGPTFSRHPGFATIEEGEEGPFGSTKADSRAASPREVCGRGLGTKDTCLRIRMLAHAAPCIVELPQQLLFPGECCRD